MRRRQIYITADQEAEIASLARERGVSKAAVIRQLLDEGLHSGGPESEARAAIQATAGICADYPDWSEWLQAVRSRGADDRLRDLGEVHPPY